MMSTTRSRQREKTIGKDRVPPRAKPRFTLHLEAAHRHDDADGMRRLRAVLKVLLRCFGFRCKQIDYPNAKEQRNKS